MRDGIDAFLVQEANVELLDEAMNHAWEAWHRLKETHEVAAADLRRWVSPAGDFIRERETLAAGKRH